MLHIDDAERIAGHGFDWRPLRKALGTTAFGVNGYTADAGGEVIENHDELSQGAAGHEELYVVHRGARRRSRSTATRSRRRRARCSSSRPGTRRGATATEDGTTVLVIGGVPGAAGPRTPFEYWYEAEPHYRSGDYARAVEVASAGPRRLARAPVAALPARLLRGARGQPRGRRSSTSKVAFEKNPDTREWAAGDDDLASVARRPAR